MEIPSCVTRNVIEKSAKGYFNSEDIEVTNYKSDPAIPSGENYTSDILRSKINYVDKKTKKEGSISIIVKCSIEDGSAQDNIAKDLNIFEKEIEMYSKTFPAMYKILGQYHMLAARCLYTEQDKHQVIVFDDLSKDGFKVCPRFTGYDLDHCLLAMEKVAQMHAASLLMYEHDPSMVKMFRGGLFVPKDTIKTWLRIGVNELINSCYKWPGCEKYAYKLTALGEDAVDRGIKSARRKMGGFHVLNHGDMWVNNMMFCYNEDGKVKDMRFIDFQMAVFTSPAIDLHYFIATSTKTSVKLNHIDTILDHYYANLLANLTRLQYPLDRVPTREQFRKDFRDRASYGFMAAATVLPLVKAPVRDDASFETLMQDDSADGFRFHAYNNDRYREHMEFLLPYYDRLGIFDFV